MPLSCRASITETRFWPRLSKRVIDELQRVLNMLLHVWSRTPATIRSWTVTVISRWFALATEVLWPFTVVCGLQHQRTCTSLTIASRSPTLPVAVLRALPLSIDWLYNAFVAACLVSCLCFCQSDSLEFTARVSAWTQLLASPVLTRPENVLVWSSIAFWLWAR